MSPPEPGQRPRTALGGFERTALGSEEHTALRADERTALRTLVLGGARSGKSAYAEALAAETDGPVRYLATAAFDPTDADFAERVARHRERRPAAWTVVETAHIDLAPLITDGSAIPAAADGSAAPVVADSSATPPLADGPAIPVVAGGSATPAVADGSAAPTPTAADGSAAPVAAGDSATTLVDDIGTWLTGRLDALGAWDAPRGTVAAEAAALVHAVEACRGRLILVSPEVGLGVVPATTSGRLFRDELGSLNQRLARSCDEVFFVAAGLPLRLK